MSDGDTRSHDELQAKVRDLIKDTTLAMLTSVGADGRLVSKPMATQDAEFTGEIWFISERDSDKVRNIGANPHVNVAYASNDSWVSVAGTASVVDDEAKLAELWDSFTGAWLEVGPENPNNVLIKVDGETAEFWDTPGSKVTQVANLVKAKVTGNTIDGDNETVELRG